MQSDIDIDDILHCRECQYYRPLWGECCFGGGWGHYPDPDDECVRMFNSDANSKITKISINKKNMKFEFEFDINGSLKVDGHPTCKVVDVSTPLATAADP